MSDYEKKGSEEGFNGNGNGPNAQISVQSLDARRRAALAEIDNAKFSWYHVKTCLVAGVGFFTDAYDLFAISIGATMIGYVYGPGNNGLTPDQDLGIKVAAPVGTLIGQLVFGWAADVVGRKKMYGLELIFIIVATFAQALSAQSSAVTIVGVLVVWRFLMGVGIGGDYPLSAVITSEFGATRIRGRMMTAVFASQGWGQLAAGIVSIIIVSAYKSALLNGPSDTPAADQMWRILIGLGCVPGVVALYFRLTIPETPRYTMDIERNVSQAAQDVETFYTTGQFTVDQDAPIVRAEVPKATFSDFCHHFGQWKNGKVLFGTAYSWFALDIAFYGLGLNSSVILSSIGFGGLSKAYAATLPHQQVVFQNLHNVSVGNIILSVAGLIPGYWATFLFIDWVGRKPIQIMGFTLLTIIFCCMGFGYNSMVNGGYQAAFVALYCLANFFQNFGPNTTTFIVPGEIFPTRYRSTGHGISAASGKLGAIIAQVGFSRLKDIGGPSNFIKHILEIFAFFMLTGLFASFLIPETMGKSLEELSGEDQEGFVAAGARVGGATNPVAESGADIERRS